MDKLILVCIVVGIIYFLIVYVLPVVLGLCATISIIMMSVGCILGMVVGTIIGIKNYILSVKHNINFREWNYVKEGEINPEPARISYAFGPSLMQLQNTSKEAFELNRRSIEYIRYNAQAYIDDRSNSDGIITIARLALKGMTARAIKIMASISIYLIGGIAIGILYLLQTLLTMFVMSVTMVIYCVVRLTDFLYLKLIKVRIDCPHCHLPVTIPAFRCSCGNVHKKLIPNKYGIFYHRCNCGKDIPATFLTGRSKLQAICAGCGSEIGASDVRPIVFQLIGGTSSGKSVFLAAFFHEFISRLRKNKLIYSISRDYKKAFDDLKKWFNGADCTSTSGNCSIMYPLIIEGISGAKRQFSIYDIPGELFKNLNNADEQMLHFDYCDGFLFIIDPYSEKKLHCSSSNVRVSPIRGDEIADSFVGYVDNITINKAYKNIPVYVLISKADMPEIKEKIGLDIINNDILLSEKNTMSNSKKVVSVDKDVIRDNICRDFLRLNGYINVINSLENNFTTVHYMPVSAMGHVQNGKKYEPWGVNEVIDTIISVADVELYRKICNE